MKKKLTPCAHSRLHIYALLLVATVCAACSQDDEETSAENTMSAADAANMPPATPTPQLDMGGPVAGDMGATPTPEADQGAPSPIPSTTSDCPGYCQHLEDCGDCLYDENGECASLELCASICEAEVPAVAASCVAALDRCDEAAFTACYDMTIGDDDCAQTCVLLEECGQCFVDDSGECLSLAACTAICREETPPAAASCIAENQSCEAIDGCFMP